MVQTEILYVCIRAHTRTLLLYSPYDCVDTLAIHKVIKKINTKGQEKKLTKYMVKNHTNQT